MAGNQRNLCAPIPIALHERVCEERDKAGLTNAQYITAVLTEYYEWKENGGKTMAQESGKTRTMAFQISEELFQRLKEHLDRETRRLGCKVTQKDFIIGLVEKALNEAEEALRTGSQTAEDGISKIPEEPEKDSEAPGGPEAEDSEAPREPVAEDGEAPAEPVVEDSEAPAEPVAEDGEAPAEPVAEDSEAPAEPEAEGGGTPAEAQDAGRDANNEESQQEDGETGGGDNETQTVENG